LSVRRLLALPLALAAALAGGAAGIVQDQCGPFTDVSPGFCPYVLELYYLGITAGTSPTTFSPDDPLTRGQAAVFVSKGLNQPLARSSPRAALGQWWTTTPPYDVGLGVTALSLGIRHVASDGADIWVAGGSVVYRVRASDGKLLETWTNATSARSVVAAMGRVFVVGNTSIASPGGASSDGVLYMIDPAQPPGPVTTVATGLGDNAAGLAFDGGRFWITNPLGPGGSSVSIVTPGPTAPWPVTTVTTGFSLPIGIVFDGSNTWVADVLAGDLLRLDANGAILQAVHTGTSQYIAFDGANIWVPGPGTVTVVQAATGAILATLTGNGVQGGNAAAFDGQRVLVTSPNADTISLWKAADLSPLGFFSTGPGSLPYQVCSDGINFWLTLGGPGQLARF
jgi:S-layer homology domain